MEDMNIFEAEPQAQASADTTPAGTTPTVDYDLFVKETFGFDSVEAAKEQFKKTTGPEFENEVSKTLYNAIKAGKEDDVFSIIQEQKKFSQLLDGDIDESKASEIIKRSYKNKYSDLTDDEINLLMSEKYNPPTKPEKGAFDDDDDYDAKVSEWQKELDGYNKKLIIDAKIAKPELAKLKEEIKLPDVENFATGSEKDSEELKKARDTYEQYLNNDYKGFDGFSISIKDEDGEKEIPITFAVSDEEKSQLKEILSDFNPDEFLYNRWFSKEGTPLVKQMMSDVYLLQNQAKILQKIGNEAASQRRLQQIKESGQVSVGSTPQRTFSPSADAEQERLADWLFSS
jgi:hypothetical protein